MDLIDNLHTILFIDTETLINYGGLFLVCAVVFCSTGLFFCFFLPSGAVLFSTGVLIANGNLQHSLLTAFTALFVSSLAGSCTGYYFGKYIGPSLYRRKDSFFFKQKHLQSAETFYQKYGGWALIAGVFLPIVRSFSTVVAGITKVNVAMMALGTGVGSFFWVLSFTGAGYFLGSRPELKPWLTYIVITFICVVTVPLLIKIIRSLRSAKN